MKDGKIDFLKKNNFSKINFIFNLSNNKIEIENFTLSFNEKKLSIPNLKGQNKKDKLQISGKLNNKETIFNKDEIKIFLGEEISNIEIEEVNFSSENNFSFEINKKFKLENLKIDSNVSLKRLVLNNDFNLWSFFLKYKEDITFEDHVINIEYSKRVLKIKGSGNYLIKDKDKIQYDITKKGNEIFFYSSIDIFKNLFKLDPLNYFKDEDIKSKITIKGKKDINEDFFLENVSFSEKNNKIDIQNLFLKKGKIKKFSKINLNFE